MLWFLSIAAKRGFVVDSYRDEAQGVMEKCADGKLAITEVRLRPSVIFNDKQIPSVADIQAMHHQAHEECFIARAKAAYCDWTLRELHIELTQLQTQVVEYRPCVVPPILLKESPVGGESWPRGFIGSV